jgi:tetratricopeptide (TPR) repeat protein
MIRLLIVLAALLGGGPQALALAAAPSGGPGERYYYFIKSNYQELDHDDQGALENMARASSLTPSSYYLKMETARLYARNDDKETALKYATEAIELSPTTPEPRLFAAWLAVSAHLWQAATNHYNDVLSLEPGNQEALTYLGALYAESGDMDQAEATFKRLVEKDPNYLSFYYLGSFYSKAGRVKEAISAFARSVKKKSDFTAALAELAGLYERVGDFKAAEKTYRALAEAQPESSMPKTRLANLLLKAGRKKEAEKLLSEISGTALNSDRGQVQFQLGLIYLEQRLYSEAAVAFESSLKVDPKNAKARYFLATALLEMGDGDRARDNLAEIPPQDDLYVEAISLLLASKTSGEDRQQGLKEALDIVAAAIKAKPESPRLQVAQAVLLEESGDLKKARKVLKAATRKFPEESEILFRLGSIEDKLEDKPAAIVALRQAIQLDPGHADAMNYLAYTWAEDPEHQTEALALAERANALKPDRGYIIDTLGWIYYQMGHAQKALTLLKRAEPLSRQDPVVLDHLGDVLMKLGRKKEAIRAYRQALDSDLTKQEKLQEELNDKINRLSN